MPAGKLAAQAGHAYTNTLLTALLANPRLALDYESPGVIGTKICLRAKNLEQLLQAKEQAEAAGYPCQLITDSGHILLPHFTGDPIVTALGIGPITKEQARPILNKFKLVV